jgi:hypothetical protein
MRTSKLIIICILICIGATMFFTIMEYTFGADKVFKWALYSMPFLLVWCLLTEKKKPTN